MITCRPSSDTQCPPSVAAGSRSKMSGGSTSRAMPLQSSGSTVMNRLPSKSAASVEIDVLEGFTRTFAPNRPFGRKLAVAGGGRGGHFFQTPFGHSVFDAVGELRARPGTSGLAARLPDLAEVRAALRGFGVPLHGRVARAELLDLNRDVTEPAVNVHQPRGQVSLAVTLRGFPHRGGSVGIRREIRCLRTNPNVTVVIVIVVVVVCAVEPQHRP